MVGFTSIFTMKKMAGCWSPPTGRRIPEGSQGLSASPRLEKIRQFLTENAGKMLGKCWENAGKNAGTSSIYVGYMSDMSDFKNVEKFWRIIWKKVGGNQLLTNFIQDLLSIKINLRSPQKRI